MCLLWIHDPYRPQLLVHFNQWINMLGMYAGKYPQAHRVIDCRASHYQLAVNSQSLRSANIHHRCPCSSPPGKAVHKKMFFSLSGNQTASPVKPRESRKTLVDLWPQASCGTAVWLAERHQDFSRVFLWTSSEPATEELEIVPQQHIEHAAQRSRPGRAAALGARAGADGWGCTCPWHWRAGVPVLKQRPRSTLWKAFLNSWLEHG